MELSQLIIAARKNAMSYDAYRDLVARHTTNNTNSGAEVNVDLTNYTALNNQRLKRLDKTLKLEPETIVFLKDFSKNIVLLIITESWCGDAAQTMPMIHKIAVAGGIPLEIVLRDDHLDLMDAFLTNGSRSIAKLIILDSKTNLPLQTWGPRPSGATALVEHEKATKGELSPEFKEELQTWYNKDKGKDTERDLVAMLRIVRN